MTSVPFILASRSPRRAELLAQAGLSPRIVAADVDEAIFDGETPLTYVLRAASEKARAVDPGPERIVLAADTVVALDGAVLRKPDSEAEAERTLQRLAGREHIVHTAVAVCYGGSGTMRMMTQVVSTSVRFRRLSGAEIQRYVATREPMDKAGAYGIQGAGGALVESVAGSYTNVVGLPLRETLRLLALAGVR